MFVGIKKVDTSSQNNLLYRSSKYYLLLPSYFWIVIFFILPFVLLVIVSVATRQMYGGYDYNFILVNYIRSFDPIYFKIILRTILYAASTSIITLLIGYPLAYYISFTKGIKKIILIFLILLPFWTNFLIRVYSWNAILGNYGIINSTLIYFGIINEPLSLLNNLISVNIGLIYGELPYVVLPLIASLERIDRSILEASTDLGGSKYFTFFNITLPLTVSGIISAIIFVFIPTLGQFVIPDLLGGNDSFMIGNIITNQFIVVRDWPFGATLSVYMMGFVMVPLYLYLRFSKIKLTTLVG